jgi:heat shock protein HslJ
MRAFLCAIAVLATGCATVPASEQAIETYRALGQEPGWIVTIAEGRIDYVGDYGETRISAPRPDPRPTFNGRRYETLRLIVDISYARCQDTMSGHGYAHQVMVIADGRTVRGCGGTRRPDWDV